MIDEAARQLGVDPPQLIRTRGTDLQLLEYFKLVKEDIAPLTNWLLLNMQPPDPAIHNSPVLRALADYQRAFWRPASEPQGEKSLYCDC